MRCGGRSQQNRGSRTEAAKQRQQNRGSRTEAAEQRQQNRGRGFWNAEMNESMLFEKLI